MINRTCCVCKGYVNDVWIVILKDDKQTVEFTGHKDHIDELHNRIKSLKGLEKKLVEKVMKELNLSLD